MKHNVLRVFIKCENIEEYDEYSEATTVAFKIQNDIAQCTLCGKNLGGKPLICKECSSAVMESLTTDCVETSDSLPSPGWVIDGGFNATHFVSAQIMEEPGKMKTELTVTKNHRKFHIVGKPYECDQCDKAFARNYALTCHRRLHTGERPYKCDECGKGFPRNYVLLRHKRRHKKRLDS
nr:unnamed protein product [Callosobruchus analis]